MEQTLDAAPVDRATLRRMLRRAYGPLAPTDDDFAQPLPSTLHTVYRVRLANGQLVVLKAAPPLGTPLLTHEADMVVGEVEALPMIAEHTGVPVPVMHHHDDSFEVVPAPWFCMSHVDGEPLGQLDATAAAPLLVQLGRLNRELNGIGGDGFGRFLQPIMTSWRDAFCGILEDALSDAERFAAPLQQRFGIVPDELYQVAIDATPALDVVTEPRYCAWNLWPGEVLVTDGPGGRQVSGAVDHSHGFWGDPLMEAIFSSALPPGQQQALLTGYGRGPLQGDELVRRALYDLLRIVLDEARRAARPEALASGQSGVVEARATRPSPDAAAVLAQLRQHR